MCNHNGSWGIRSLLMTWLSLLPASTGALRGPKLMDCIFIFLLDYVLACVKNCLIIEREEVSFSLKMCKKHVFPSIVCDIKKRLCNTDCKQGCICQKHLMLMFHLLVKYHGSKKKI